MIPAEFTGHHTAAAFDQVVVHQVSVIGLQCGPVRLTRAATSAASASCHVFLRCQRRRTEGATPEHLGRTASSSIPVIQSKADLLNIFTSQRPDCVAFYFETDDAPHAQWAREKAQKRRPTSGAIKTHNGHPSNAKVQKAPGRSKGLSLSRFQARGQASRSTVRRVNNAADGNNIPLIRITSMMVP